MGPASDFTPSMPIFIGIPPMAHPIKTFRGTTDSVSADLKIKLEFFVLDSEHSFFESEVVIPPKVKTIDQPACNNEPSEIKKNFRFRAGIKREAGIQGESRPCTNENSISSRMRID